MTPKVASLHCPPGNKNDRWNALSARQLHLKRSKSVSDANWVSGHEIKRERLKWVSPLLDLPTDEFKGVSNWWVFRNMGHL